MANQYTKLTKENILRKVNRKRNPVTSLAQLAREFGHNTSIYRRPSLEAIDGRSSTAAPASFRRKVKALVGETTYNKIRDSRKVNIRARY